MINTFFTALLLSSSVLVNASSACKRRSSSSTAAAAAAAVQTASLDTDSHVSDTVSALSATVGAGKGKNMTVATAKFRCDVISDLSIVRDGGGIGKIQDTIIFTYGDTQPNKTADPDATFYLVSDSSSIGTDDPCFVLNTQRNAAGDRVENMVQLLGNETTGETATGGSAVVATHDNKGMMFFLKVLSSGHHHVSLADSLQNHRPDGTSTIIGGGVAEVTLTPVTHNITTTRLSDYWWETDERAEPQYGDSATYSNGTYVWGVGHGGPENHYAYLLRAPLADDAWKELKNWEYYDGSKGAYSTNRLYNATSDQSMRWSQAEGAIYMVGQGQMVWSEYFQKIMWIYGYGGADNGWTWTVWARLADTPEGPWGPKVALYTVPRLGEGDYVYNMIANTHLDPTGKSIVVTVDNGSGTIQATDVTFG